jgi:hypothetical protein
VAAAVASGTVSVENGDMGIVMSLPGLQHDGDVLTATVTGTSLATTRVTGSGSSTSATAVPASRSTSRRNRSEGNGAGLTSGNISTDDSAIGVLQPGNVYAANGTGIFVPGNAVFGDPAVATDGPSAGTRTT